MLRPASLVALAFCLTTVPTAAFAAWPPPADITQAQAADRANWPNDPDYDGQFEHWSFVPASNQALPGFRSPEIALGAGHSTDRAWGLSQGDPRVLLAILDCGIRWDEQQLIENEAINIGELPLPHLANGNPATDYDANGDGVINVVDYANDARVPCGTSFPHNVRHCRDGAGQPNDPNANGILDAGDLIRVFTDHVDDDHNGYTDDIAGWDFFHDDNDPFDDTNFGHGTGEARWSNAPGNDGIGSIGGCPKCQFIMLRAGDSFITSVNDFAQATVYAADADYGRGRRVRVVQEALGTINNTEYAMQALDYAWAKGVIVAASAADENSNHHNMPGTNNHTLYVHAIQYPSNTITNATSFLAYNNCSNYGGQLQLSVEGTGCSSEATGQSAGIAGLIYSYGLQRNLAPELNADEVNELFLMTADDIDIPESRPGAANYDMGLYQSLPGWDQRFAYGRPNSRRALEWVRDGKIPPVVDITSPRWFTSLFPDHANGRRLVIEGTIAARRASNFDYTVEWAAGIEPAANAWHTIRQESHVTAPMNHTLGDLDLSTVMIDNPGEVENRYTLTVRIRATAHYDGTIGDVPGERRRVFYVLRDPDLLPGYPIDVRSSGESSPKLADLNGDHRSEMVLVTADGLVHAFQADGSELGGFPVHTNPEVGLNATDPVNYLGAAAYSRPLPSQPPPIDASQMYETVMSTPAVADLDHDGNLEIIVASYSGTLYVFNHDGTAYGHGFPRQLLDVPSSDTNSRRVLSRGIFGSPVIYDLNGDTHAEIIFGAFDGKLYAMQSTDARDYPGFPVLIHHSGTGQEFNRIFGSVGVGRFNNDAIPDIVVVSNERIVSNNGDTDRQTGAAYIVHGDGNLHEGGPIHPHWPIVLTSLDFFPLVGEGLSVAPAIADLDHDGTDELALVGNGLPSILMARGTQTTTEARPDISDLNLVDVLRSSDRGALSDRAPGQIGFVPVFALGSFGDMTNDGTLEYIHSGATVNLAGAISGGGRRVAFQHLFGAWNAVTGYPLPGFPRVIDDYTFFMNPTMADISGDAYPEAIIGTGGFYLHAVDGCGREPAGFPKFTGQWIIPSPAVGDLDNDGKLEVVTGTRSGYVFAWKTQGTTTGSVQWPTMRHDNSNTGNYGTPTGLGVRRVDGAGPLVCPGATTTDGGVTTDGSAIADGSATTGDGSATGTDGSALAEGGTGTPGGDAGAGAGADAGTGNGTGACGCRTAGSNGRSSTAPFALGVATLGLAFARRRRRE